MDPTLPVTAVTASSESPPALLDSEDRARDVTRAIEEIVKRIRR
jgi:hypothetical protein